MFYLQLRNELWKLFTKKRTYIGFGAFLATQLAIVLIFRFYSNAREIMIRPLVAMGYPVEEYVSCLTIAVPVLIYIAMVLMPLYVALVGGDLVAKEVEDGTLRMILCRPISRWRLLLVKWLAGVIFSILLVMALGAMGVGFARCLFPTGGLFVMMPWDGVISIYDPGAGWRVYLMANALLTLKAISIMSLAFMFSCYNMKPAAATIVGLSVILISRILQEMPYFADIQHWFITYHLDLWASVFRQPVPWPQMGGSLCLLAGFNLSFLILGWLGFQIRNIKS